MEMQAKFIISSAQDFNLLVQQVLGPCTRHLVLYDRFLDTSELRLASGFTQLRLRVADLVGSDGLVVDRQAQVTVKEKALVDQGSALRWVRTEAVSPPANPKDVPVIGWLPWLLENVPALAQHLVGKFAITALETVGDILTQRQQFDWKGMPVQVDCSRFPFGDGDETFEVEIPCLAVPVSDVIEDFGALLHSHNIGHVLATESKYDHMMRRLKETIGQSTMDQQVKLHLLSFDDYNRVRNLLSSHGYTFVDETTIDDAYLDHNLALSKQSTALRVRLTHTAQGGVVGAITLREHSHLSGGSAVRWVQKWDIPPTQISRFIDACRSKRAGEIPRGLWEAVRDVNLQLQSTLTQQFHVNQLSMLGVMRTVRHCFRSPTMIIRVDRTTFPSGATSHAIEVPDVIVPVHDVVQEMKELLDLIGVHYAESAETKFGQLLRDLQSGFSEV